MFWMGLVGSVLAVASLKAAAPDPGSLYAWYRGDAGLVADASGRVTAWQNQAATGTPALRNLDRISGTPQSVGVRTPAGVRSIVRCNGTSGVWVASSAFGTLSGSRTVIVYCQRTGSGDGFLFDSSANAGGLTRAQVRGGTWQVGLQPSGGGANADPVTLSASTNTWEAHVFTFERLAASTVVTHAIHGGPSFRYTNSLTGGLGGFILGQNVAASRGLEVEVAEVLIYDRVLTETESEAVTGYLVDTWGTPVEIPPAGCAVAQTSRVVPDFGLHALLDVQVLGPGVVTNLTFTLEGTTDVADVAALSVYGTGTGADFRPLARFGAVERPAAGVLSVAGTQTLEPGVNHFWIAIEPRRSAPWGHVFDAALLDVSLVGEVRTPLVGSPPGVLTLGNGIFSTILRRSGDDGVHTYRIPGLVTTPRGTLIAVFDLRWNSSADLPANVDVGCLRSTDGGSTWHWPTQGKAILDYDKTVVGSSGNGVGDPAILVDRETGTLWVAALWSFGNRAYTGSGAGLGTNQTGQYVLTRSDDDGLSWSPPINITAQAKVKTSWGVCFQGPGHGIQLRDGTLLFPSQHTDPGGVNARAFFIYSTNRGESWLASPDVNPTIPPQLNENQMVELNSGQILVSSRAPSGGGGKRVWSTYTRGSTPGNGSWSPLVYNLPDPVCQASLVRHSSTLDGAPRNRLLFANPGSASSRIQMTIRMSEDEGQTWTVERRIDNRPAAYSDLTVLADGTVGLLYETGDSTAYETLTFVRFSLDWLTRADVDTDGDGLSDYYEGINGFTQGVNDADADADGDGLTNLDEFEAGTMANDPGSVFRLLPPVVGPVGWELRWTTVPGRVYSLWGASDPAGDWRLEADARDRIATGPWMAHPLAAMTEPIRFYRVLTP